MVLDTDEQKALDKIMAQLFTTVDELDAFLSVNLKQNLQSFVHDNLTVSRAAVIDRAQRLGWLVDLIEELREIAPPALKTELDEKIGTVEELREARFHDDCYPNQEPLVNRKDLRAKLRSASVPGSTRIVLIKGDRYSGKSHARRHLRHVATRLGMPLAEFSLSEYAPGEKVRPYDFGVGIADALGKTLPAHLDAKASRWSVNFLGWLRHQVADGLWIAFDDFEKEKLKVKLPESVHEFIELLAKRVDQMSSVRLFLINYDRELPSELGFYLVREDVPSIEEGDISDFFVDFHTSYLPPVPLDDVSEDAAKRAKKIMATIGSDPATRLQEMRKVLRDECEALKKEKT